MYLEVNTTDTLCNEGNGWAISFNSAFSSDGIYVQCHMEIEINIILPPLLLLQITVLRQVSYNVTYKSIKYVSYEWEPAEDKTVQYILFILVKFSFILSPTPLTDFTHAWNYGSLHYSALMCFSPPNTLLSLQFLSSLPKHILRLRVLHSSSSYNS